MYKLIDKSTLRSWVHPNIPQALELLKSACKQDQVVERVMIKGYLPSFPDNYVTGIAIIDREK